MKSEIDAVLRVPLDPVPAQELRLQALQQAFAEVCNAIAPLVVQTGVWNRVALHHMAYKPMRARFPQLGSQLICNAIYAVSRTCRWVFQRPGSTYHVSAWRGRALPQLHFSPRCPVYLDRNTFSLKQGQASLYTLDGRMRFELALGDRREALFHSAKLVEIVLLRVRDRYEMRFHLQAGTPQLDAEVTALEGDSDTDDLADNDYLQVDGQPLAIPTLAGRERASSLVRSGGLA